MPSSPIPRLLAFYLRVSTVSQDYPSQMHAMREYCRRHGWPLPPKSKIFAEKISGKREKRTQLDRLLTACRDGHVDTIVMYRVDRLGNSMQHLVNVQAELDGLKIRMIGVADGIDTAIATATTNAWRNWLNTAATYNRELISERTRDGLRAARARGNHPGRPRKSDAKLAKALELHKQGLSNTAIGKKVKLSDRYISTLLKKHNLKPHGRAGRPTKKAIR